MFNRNMPVPTTQSLVKIAAVCCCFYLTSPMADDTLAEPSREDLSRFVTPYDGETRPDLVPFHRKIEEALAGYKPKAIRLDDYRWKTYCNGLYQLPAAA